jgi:hypothetical protein
MRVFFLVTCLFAFGPALAAQVSVGPSKIVKDGQHYSQSGCSSLSNITGNLGEGIVVAPEISWDHDIWICGDIDVDGTSFLDVLNQVGAIVKDCMTIQSKIDSANKQVRITPTTKMKTVTRIEDTMDTYKVDGKVAFHEPSTETKVIQMCILETKSLEAPYDKFLK